MIERLKKHLVKHNIIFAQALGLCPALAVSSTAKMASIMGGLTLAVLVSSSVLVSMIRKLVPQQARIPIFIVIIAGFVTLVDILMQAYSYQNYKIIGIFIPLIVVNCSVLATSETIASKSDIVTSFVESILAGIGFLFAITLIGSVREFLALGSLFDVKIYEFTGMLIFLTPAGAFIALGCILAVINAFSKDEV